MNLQELIALYRADGQDGKNSIGGCDDDVLCSDELLTIYANEAQDEACRRGQLLRDSTSSWCTIKAAAGAEAIGLNALAIQILRAFADGQPLTTIHVDEMDCLFPGWQFQSAQNRPTHLVTGVSTGQLYLWPRPAQECTIKLTVQRLPLKPMRADTDKPEIRQELHPALVNWMLYRVYGRTDSDIFDPSKAAVSLANFEAEFGSKSSGRNETWVRQGDGLMPGPIA
ncbi:DUF6682 family protein [Comamonas odontotermitis]|uniref:phage adaptor protein n=1 Tax=Comamonas TaxID=283 RepID=UPI00375134A8